MITSLKEKNSSFSLNRRIRTLLTILIAIVFLISVVLGSILLDEGRMATNLHERNSPPSLDHLFGTDWLGRDMFTRTIMGLSLSMGVGLIGAIGSTINSSYPWYRCSNNGKSRRPFDFMVNRPFS